MTEVLDPRTLFPELARRHFRFLERDFGFHLVASDGYWVEWNGNRTNVSVGYFGPKCDFTVSVHRGSDVFEVGELAALNGIQWEWGTVSGTEERLTAALEAAADLLKTVGGPVLRGDPGVFEALREQRDRECAASERARVLRRIREAGDKAWCDKNYTALVQACEPHRADLSRFEVARLDYALKKLQDSPDH